MTKIPEHAQKSECNPAPCPVVAGLSVDRCGQIVIPKEVRKRASISEGNKHALVSWSNKDVVWCLALIRTNNLSSEVSGVMHSLLEEKDI